MRKHRKGGFWRPRPVFAPCGNGFGAWDFPSEKGIQPTKAWAVALPAGSPTPDGLLDGISTNLSIASAQCTVKVVSTFIFFNWKGTLFIVVVRSTGSFQ